jgi:putative transcriptional regulator
VVKIKETQQILCAPAPAGVIEDSRADVIFIAGVLVDKFAWHLPLYCQNQRLEAAGITVSRPWLTQISQKGISLLAPIYQAQYTPHVKRKRSLFSELNEGFDALAENRAGKRTLRTHAVKMNPLPTVTPAEVSRLRERMNLSRAVFARYLRTNVRTLENWEQGRAEPNAQAALLIRKVQRYPDTVERLSRI